MTTYDNVFLVKTSNIFECKNCNYTTSRKYNFQMHNKSIKHKNNCLTTFDNEKLAKTSKKHLCENCNKHFNDRAGLWRHKKKCNNVINIDEKNKKEELMNDKDLIQYLLKENLEFKQLMIEQNKHMIELAKKYRPS
jgi:hypothetical protein